MRLRLQLLSTLSTKSTSRRLLTHELNCSCSPHNLHILHNGFRWTTSSTPGRTAQAVLGRRKTTTSTRELGLCCVILAIVTTSCHLEEGRIPLVVRTLSTAFGVFSRVCLGSDGMPTYNKELVYLLKPTFGTRGIWFGLAGFAGCRP